MGGTEDTKDVSTSKILRMYQPAGVVPQETIDGSTLGRKGYIIGFFNLNLFKGMCVCMCICVCVCVCVWISTQEFLSRRSFALSTCSFGPGETRRPGCPIFLLGLVFILSRAI